MQRCFMAGDVGGGILWLIFIPVTGGHHRVIWCVFLLLALFFLSVYLEEAHKSHIYRKNWCVMATLLRYDHFTVGAPGGERREGG